MLKSRSSGGYERVVDDEIEESAGQGDDVTEMNDVQLNVDVRTALSPASARTPTPSAVDDGEAVKTTAVKEHSVNSNSGKHTKVVASPSIDLTAKGDGDCILVNIKTPDDKTIGVKISQSATVYDLKKSIEKRMDDLTPDRMRLIFQGQLLNNDNKLLKDHKVKNKSFIHLVPRLIPTATAIEIDLEAETTSPGRQSRHYTAHSSFPVQLDSMNVHDHPLSFEISPLHFYRTRVKLLSLLMFFFYTLQLMGALALFFHPDGPDDKHNTRQQQQFDKEIDLFFLKLVEYIMGVSTGLVGIKASSTMNPQLSIRFWRSLISMAVLYAVGGVLQTVYLIRGDYDDDPNLNIDHSTDGIIFNVMLYAMIGCMIWGSCIMTAAKFHTLLVESEGGSSSTV